MRRSVRIQNDEDGDSQGTAISVVRLADNPDRPWAYRGSDAGRRDVLPDMGLLNGGLLERMRAGSGPTMEGPHENGLSDDSVGFLDPVPPGHAWIRGTDLEVARSYRRMKKESPNQR